MVGIYHNADRVADGAAHGLDAAYILGQRRIADLYFYGAKTLGDGAGADFLHFCVVVVEPADHGVGANGLLRTAPQLPAGHAALFAQTVPQCGVEGGDADGGQTGAAVVFRFAAHLGVQVADHMGVLADEQGFELVLDKSCQCIGRALDAAKKSVAAAADTGVRCDGD